MPMIDLMYLFYRNRLVRIALFFSLMAPAHLTQAQTENRHLIPDDRKQELSDFYNYLRARYGMSRSEDLFSADRGLAEKKSGKTGTDTIDQKEKARLQTPEEDQGVKDQRPSASKELNAVRPEKKIPENKRTERKKPAGQNPALKKITPDRQEQISKQKSEDRLLAMAETVELPLPEKSFIKAAPEFYRGLYINNAFVRSKGFENFLVTAKEHGINVLVIDIQPRMPLAETLRLVETMGFYPVARVVVFDDGLKTYPASERHLERVLNRAEEGARAGFAEIQLDYIRFADNLHIRGLTLKKRYEHISSILSQFEQRLRPYRVRISADIFGRIVFNRHDIIGQRLELFDQHLDVIYPMLYPSHFYGDPDRRRYPYHTIFDGTVSSRRRVKNSRIVPYIQAFGMRVGESGLSLQNYIRVQLDAAEDSGGAGYVAWNARNDYSVFFRALRSGRLMPAATRRQ
jgi:hypothetical protein